ncbi:MULTISPECIES: ABC transporter substrate-binding protein [Jonquetella]|uniref:ABC-type dipeptide transport system, periplasmic component n=1 Tax=Jonquetella anthropi DSM 22815 TaxID=885272 RepID=H0UKZ1_9BACT|nr:MULTISPECIES: ABC transporter substrate-binding protein [Jonquetella]EHM13350.1 ABC-type dipeptide transport system, periplasmic component [Jonquetella anthropi DSM 22815]ERL23841.1 ABC transporter, substrate-binding protein, family 5 [Jonquetella sp. BV3C21]
MNRKLAILAVGALLGLSSVAFAGGRGETLRVGVAIDAKNFDPQNSVDTFSFSMQKQIYEPLVTVDGKTRKLVPVLAESWEMLDDVTYKFHLRKGVKFHNGEELTADDVVFSLKRVTDPAQSVFAKSKGIYIDPNGFEIIDKYTVIVRTNGVVGGFLGSMKHPYASIMNRKAVEEAGKEYFRHPVGTGPYKFVSWTKGEKVELEAFKDYWGEKPYAEKMTFVVLPDDSSRVIALETNKVDMIYAVPSGDFNRLSESSDVKVVKAPGLVLLHLGMNTQNPKLSDPRVRLAIEYAINKDAYNQVVYNGNAVTPKGPLPTACSWFPEDAKPWPFDPEKAKKLLAEAGVKLPLELNLWVINAQDRIDGATVIQSMLAQVGINVNVQVFENAVFDDKLKEGKHDMYLGTWGMQTNRDAGIYWQSLFTIPAIGSTNKTFLKDELVDGYIKEATQTANEDKRSELFQKIWDRLNELHPFVYLSHADELNGGQKDIIGLEDLYDGKVNYLGNVHYPEQERLK